MTNGEATKAFVSRWFATGIGSPAGLEMVTDDFVWYGPPSMAEIFEGAGHEAVLRGKAGLSRLSYLDKALYANYTAGGNHANVHFIVAEDDICVMAFDAAFTTHDGDSYHNQYCIVFRVRDGKIAEVREHADTLYSHDVCMGTPEKRIGVLDRLARLRAGENI